MRRINGANSRMLASFTSKTIQQEAGPATTSLNLVIRLHQRWLGHSLGGDQSGLTFQAVTGQWRRADKGSLLMDSPPHNHFDELVSFAQNRVTWRSLVRKLV